MKLEGYEMDFLSLGAQQGGVAATLYICIREVFGSNLGRDSNYPEEYLLLGYDAV
jgi:hypothetical protein